MNQIEFYEAKLKYETDSWDLSAGGVRKKSQFKNFVMYDCPYRDAPGQPGIFAPDRDRRQGSS